MAKMNISTTTAAALTALLLPVLEGAGKLWDGTRDAFVVALGDFQKPEDAAKAIRQHITDALKANPGSIKGYLSTAVWLANNGHTDQLKAGIKYGAAENLRYPKPLKPGQDGYMEQQAAKDKAAKDAKEQAEREAEANRTPRGDLLSDLARLLKDATEAELSVIIPEVATILDTLRAEPEQAQPETEQDQAIAA